MDINFINKDHLGDDINLGDELAAIYFACITPDYCHCMVNTSHLSLHEWDLLQNHAQEHHDKSPGVTVLILRSDLVKTKEAPTVGSSESLGYEISC